MSDSQNQRPEKQSQSNQLLSKTIDEHKNVIDAPDISTLSNELKVEDISNNEINQPKHQTNTQEHSISQKLLLQGKNSDQNNVPENNIPDKKQSQTKQISKENLVQQIQKLKQIYLNKNLNFIESKKTIIECQQKYQLTTANQAIKSIQIQISEIQQLQKDFDPKDPDFLQLISQNKTKIKQLINFCALAEVIEILQPQYQKQIIEKAMIEFGVKSEEQIEFVVNEKISSNNKKRKLYESKKMTQKIKQIDGSNDKFEQIKLIITKHLKNKAKSQSEIKNNQIEKQKTPKLEITLCDKKITKQIQYKFQDQISIICQAFQVELDNNFNRYQIEIYLSQKSKYMPLAQDKIFKDVVDLYTDYKCVIKKLHQVTFNSQTFNFSDGTDLRKIQKQIGQKNFKYVFYDDCKRQYKQQQINQNLSMIEIQSMSITFGESVYKNIDIPTNISLKQISSYVKFKQIINQQLLDTLFIFAIKFDSSWKDVRKQQQSTINEIAKGKIIEGLNISFKLQVLVMLTSKKSNREINFLVDADKNIEEHKKQFEALCQLEYKLQRWTLDNQELMDHQNFINLKLFGNRIRIKVHQVENYQYYGFSQYQPIQTEIFVNYNVQNDKRFIDFLEKSKFPAKQFEFTFRMMCLSVIFSAIKKHCKISSALKHIKKLIKKTKLSNIVDDENKNVIWQSSSRNKASYFNQFYVLHNILQSSGIELHIQLMKVYKNHNPLFLTTFNQRNQKINYKIPHFWINLKSFVVTSIQIGQKVTGKSKLLNILFNTNFELQESRHPICSNSVLISYNIYKNQDCLVDLIDVSSGSLSEQQKLQLCQHSNLVIVHCYKENQNLAQKWIKDNCKQTRAIIFIRDSCKIMDSNSQFKSQLNKNEENLILKKYNVPELTNENIKYYNHQLEEILDQLHKFIIFCYNNSKYQDLERFSHYLCKNDKSQARTLDILKQIQQNFSKMVDPQILKSQITTKEQIDQLLSENVRKIISQQNISTSEMFMSKMKQSIRIFRSRRMKKFVVINQLQKLVEIKNIDFKNLDNLAKRIAQCIQQLQIIPLEQATVEFKQVSQKMKQIKIDGSDSIQKLQISVKILNKILIQQIKERQFSIENFWRCLSKVISLDHQKLEITQQLSKNIPNIKKLYIKQFRKGKTFQIINGDNLEIPIYLLKSIQLEIGNKKIMIVGVFGPQSSGKSTLLNFIFGCDFASSDGRCTNGIYGTYYEIQNGCYPFDGVLVLDTQGLFSNYVRTNQRGQNFDNKLVLFLLKTCDILIMNTRGDVDNNCENILEISFDSVLMQHKQGAIYPNFYIVLNQSVDKINAEQQREVARLRNKIVEVNKEMERFISTNQTNSMPIAFENISNRIISSEVLKSIQLKDKTPTDEFYRQTKQLSLKFIQILLNRSRDREPKVLMDVFDNMNAVWVSILSSPILTMHATKSLKQLSQQMEKQAFQKIAQSEKLINAWLLQIPEFYHQFEDWQKNKEIEFQNNLNMSINSLSKSYAFGPDSKRNNIIKNILQKTGSNIQAYYESFTLKVTEKKLSLQFSQNKKKGVDGLMRIAKNLRKQVYKDNLILTDQIKDKQFNNAWQNHVKILTDGINFEKISKQIIQKVGNYYGNQSSTTKYFNKNAKICINSENSIQQQAEKLKKQIYKEYNQNFYNYFSQLNVDPIISVKANEASSLPNFYLKMRQFFQLEPQTLYQYFPNKQINQILKFDEIIKQILILFGNSEISHFRQQLESDLRYFNVKMKKQQFQNYFTYKIFSSLKSLCFNIKQKVQLNHDWIVVLQDHSQCNTKNRLKNYSNNFQKFLTLNNQMIIKAVGNQNKLMQSFRGWCPKTVIKQIVKEALKQYFTRNSSKILSLFNYEVAKMSQIVTKQLNNIGFNLDQKSSLKFFKHNSQNQISLRYQPTFSDINKPLQYKTYSSFSDNLSNCSSTLINKAKLKQKCSFQYMLEGSLIAQIKTQKVSIKQQHRNVNILKNYMNKDYEKLMKGVKTKQFKQFIFNHILKDQIFNIIIQRIEKQSNDKSLEDLVASILGVVKYEISRFNQDLKQISHELSFGFISYIHSFCFSLICHKLLTQQKIALKQQQNKMNSEREKQRQLFMDLLNAKTEERCKASAKIFVDSYFQFIDKQILKNKEVYLQTKKSQFLQKYRRRHFQQIIDKEMETCNDEIISYQYLMKPRQYLQKQYTKLIQSDINHFFKAISLPKVSSALNQICTNTKNMSSELAGNQYLWQSDLLFQKIENEQNYSIFLRRIFIELLKQQEDIDNKYQGNKYYLKNGIIFNNKLHLQQDINQKFLAQELNDQNFEVENFAFFVKFLAEHLTIKLNHQKASQDIKFNTPEIQKFRTSVQMNFCLFDCPLCGRMCDVDLLQKPDHDKHECSSGHQMRAIKNIQLQMKQGNGKKTKYSSLLRCQDVDEFTMFNYDGTQKLWKQHKKQFPDWNFDAGISRGQKFMFENLWKNAGKRICMEKQKGQKIEMKYLNYAQYNQKLKQKSSIPFHYIFSIDGSGSMSGTKWTQQIEQMTEILSCLSKDIENRTSINVFTDDPNIYCTKQYPSEIYPKSIPFPSGATDKEAIGAFKGGVQIIQKTGLDMNIHFLYISDGHGVYPQQQIKDMLVLKNKLLSNGFMFNYTSILIGGGSRDGMNKINQQMKGESQWVNSAGEIGVKFKQLYQSKVGGKGK